MGENKGDDVLGKADAFMRRHRSFVAGGAQPAQADEDVPLLTEVFDLGQAAPALSSELAGGPGAEELASRMRELLAPLPPDIARAVEDWLAATLPRLVASRLDGIAEQVAEEVGAALRDSLPLLIADLVHAAAERVKPEE